MKYFKIKPTRLAKRYEINPHNFEKYTEHKKPYELRDKDGKLSQYAICPSCLNPIQLIGVVKEIKVTPYGKHTGKDIPNLAKWNYKKYVFCPFAKKGQRIDINDNDLFLEVTDDIIELYYLLKNQFDRVVYIISKELDIHCTFNFWEKALKQYLKNKIFLYPWLTESNLPYVFAMRGMQHQNIYGQQFRIDSELFNKLKNYKNVKFEELKTDKENANKNCEYMILSSSGGFVNLQFRFTNHRQRAVDGEILKESMKFCVDDLLTGNTVFEKQINFEENYFVNMINKSKNEDKRNEKLLAIAEKIMQGKELE